MTDTVVLLEEKKETTTFFLDEGKGKEQRVVTATGETLATVYPEPINVDETVSISPKSDIGIPIAKKYENGEIILGIAINEPINNSTMKMRETGILILGQLFRLKLAKGQNNIATLDRLAIGEDGAIKDNSDGDFVALHPVEDQTEYQFIDVLRPFNIP